MKLLVTGGAGFIGSNFILYWLRNYPKDQIINFDALTYAGHLENLESVENHPNYTFVKGEIADKKLVSSLLAGVEAIVHFAAESHVDRSIVNPSKFVTTNVLGTQALLEAAVQARVKRFHHISTDEVFGDLDLNNDQKFNESSPYNPSSPYAASKAGSDFLVRAYARTYGLPVTISNSSNNYGPYQTPEKLIPLAITRALENKPVPVYGDGLNVRDWMHAEDHCRGIDLILKGGKTGETYCIGGGEEVANIDMVRHILKILGKSESLIQFVKDRPGHDRRYAIDFSKIKRELGYAPAFDLHNGLQETVKWYMNNRTWCKKVISKI